MVIYELVSSERIIMIESMIPPLINKLKNKLTADIHHPCMITIPNNVIITKNA